MNDPIQFDKTGLIGIAAIAVISLCGIAVYSIYHGLNSEAATLVGVIVTGLAALTKDIVAALRGYSMAAQLGKVTDQLAASQPSASIEPVPQDAVDGAQAATDAAQAKHDELAGKATTEKE
jgi:hypothetical protein